MNAPAKKIEMPFSVSSRQWRDWRWQMRNRVRSVAELGKSWGWSYQSPATAVAEIYPLAVTPYFLAQVKEMDGQKDPLARQCLPDPGELLAETDGSPDPLQEERHMPVLNLLHRYEDRCLVLATNRCAVHCRHCNRKRQWQRPDWVLDAAGLTRMVDYVTRNIAIREVIISGGDPLTLADRHLDVILGAFRGIPHVEVLRIGTRTPAVLPMRITPRLCRILARHRPLWLNTQFNHLWELTPEAVMACEMLLKAGIPVSSQSVLLNKVNDNYEALRDLVHGLQRAGVRPYYLFQADNVAGTAVYRADSQNGRRLVERLRQSTAGLCIPRYVEDRPGRTGKEPLDEQRKL